MPQPRHDVPALLRLAQVAAAATLLFAVLASCTTMRYAAPLCAVMLCLALLAYACARNLIGLLVLVAVSATSCSALDLDMRQWTIQTAYRPLPVRYKLSDRVRLAATSELDALVDGCNAFLLNQRDAAIVDEQKVRKTQKVVAIIAAAVEVVVGSVALSLKSYDHDNAAALTGGIGSVVTGALTGTTLEMLITPDPAYGQRRDAIMAAWNAIDAYSASTTQPDPQHLAELKAKLRNACSGITP
jgi:hypothetical protein